MNKPAQNSVLIDDNVVCSTHVSSAVVAWIEEFFSDPENRKAYAAWCNENGLEYDLPESPQEE